MKTIVKPKDHIDKLWGKQRTNETEVYRIMHYVLQVEHDGKMLMHNVVTGELVELDQVEVELLGKLPIAYTPLMDQLIEKHYLVPEGFDEYKSVKQLRLIYRTRQTCATGEYINHYVILPTTFCNAHCFYCYESDYPRVHMTEDTANKLIEYMDVHREGKELSIQWFGGEPLVGIQRIDQISQGLKDRGITYSASMISNGYLFDESIVERAAELWKLQRVQITLDGTEETYNQVKAYVNVKDNPFQRVLRNIDLLSSRKIHVNIRLNIDFYNKDNIRELIEELGKRYSGNQFVTVYLNMLFNDEGYEPVSHSHDDMIQLMEIIKGYTKRLIELKMAFDEQKPIYLLFSQCMADNPHAIMIQPDGSFCRCEHETILENYGNLDEGVKDPQKLVRWRESTEHSDKCPECAIYPTCYSLKHCANSDLPCTESLQMNNLKRQKERIKNLYVHKTEVKEDETVCCSPG